MSQKTKQNKKQKFIDVKGKTMTTKDNCDVSYTMNHASKTFFRHDLGTRFKNLEKERQDGCETQRVK